MGLICMYTHQGTMTTGQRKCQKKESLGFSCAFVSFSHPCESTQGSIEARPSRYNPGSHREVAFLWDCQGQAVPGLVSALPLCLLRLISLFSTLVVPRSPDAQSQAIPIELGCQVRVPSASSLISITLRSKSSTCRSWKSNPFSHSADNIFVCPSQSQPLGWARGGDGDGQERQGSCPPEAYRDQFPPLYYFLMV